MRIPSIALLLLAGVSSTAWTTPREAPTPPLPLASANNAVAVLTTPAGRRHLVSFAGLGPGKAHGDTHARTFVLEPGADAWREGPPVPGGVGRLASVAVALGPHAFVFGGYSVASDGTERSTPWVHAFDPTSMTFAERAPMPVPVDDAVAVTYRDRYVYLISGWHDLANVNLVQRYDSQRDRWDQATPLPGPAVFGHAGGIVDDSIVYCDGVAVAAHTDRRRDFRLRQACYLGVIDGGDSRRIDWRRIDPHPGRPRYRMAATGVPALGAVVFLGGSTNPYNYDGIGYDGEPSPPAAGGFSFHLESRRWQAFTDDAPASMDHRALVPWEGRLVTVGGMLADQQVTDRLIAHPVPNHQAP